MVGFGRGYVTTLQAKPRRQMTHSVAIFVMKCVLFRCVARRSHLMGEWVRTVVLHMVTGCEQSCIGAWRLKAESSGIRNTVHRWPTAGRWAPITRPANYERLPCHLAINLSRIASTVLVGDRGEVLRRFPGGFGHPRGLHLSLPIKLLS